MACDRRDNKSNASVLSVRQRPKLQASELMRPQYRSDGPQRSVLHRSVAAFQPAVCSNLHKTSRGLFLAAPP